MLLGSSASLDARTEFQETPLEVFCFNGKRDVAHFLIDRAQTSVPETSLAGVHYTLRHDVRTMRVLRAYGTCLC